MVFDPNKEERQGAWLVPGLYSVAAMALSIAALWISRAMEVGSGPHSGVGVPLLLVGLGIVGIASLVLGLVGVVIVIYGLVRITVHGPVYVLGSVVATCLAFTPIVMGWNELNEPSSQSLTLRGRSSQLGNLALATGMD